MRWERGGMRVERGFGRRHDRTKYKKVNVPCCELESLW